MVKLKDRTLKELYTDTDSISEPEVLSQAGSDSGCHSTSPKVRMRAESGTCNVCSSPCSSCMHDNQNLMGLQVDQISDENCNGETDSQYSINEGNCFPRSKSRASDNQQYTASGTSNIPSVTSSHNPFSENVESKAKLKSPYISASEVVEMCPNSKSEAASDLVTLSNKFQDTVLKDGQNKHGSKFKDEDEDKPRDMSEDENDDSDLVEHDVKVCDICGDAGREDLLAVCSRCSDGAEHTYCMREKMDKLPEDDWVCDECNLIEESEKQKHYKDETLNEKYLDVKLDLEDSDVETNRIKKVCQSIHISYKRLSDKTDVDSAVRRQPETSASSPKVSNPSRTTSLSRDSSFKNIEKGKSKLSHQMSLVTSTTSPWLQSDRGSLFKSSSFNSVNNKPRVKPADDLISHKHKGARELSSFEPKEGSIKVMTKSKSFKSSNSSRSIAPESKVKMISPRFPQFQDVREHRKAKERSASENKSNSDSPMANSAFRDSRPVQIEGKSTSSKTIGKDKRHSILSSTGVCLSEEPLESAQITASSSDVEEGLESTNQTERTADNLVPHSRHGVTSSRPSVDTSASRGSVVVINEDNKLKAAIHAAMLKKPGICKKKILTDHTDGLSSPSTNLNSEAASQKHHSFRTCDSDVITASDGKHNMREFPTHATAMLSAFLQTSVIPEHDYIWQGGFEVHRSGIIPELCPGIQAHLSTCVSPKVIDVVNKFAFRVPLTEVPRLSTWPMQFQDSGPTEDHIALYFFAKDVESYDKNYRSLLESMMKNDIVLKGSIDGIELLVFSSNQLPKKSQRWNMMFFLWGVFRTQRVDCSDHLSFSENLDVAGLLDEKSSGLEKKCSSVPDSKTSTSLKVPILPFPETMDGSRDFKVSLLKIPTSSTQEIKSGEDRKLDVELPVRRNSLCRGVEMYRSHEVLNDHVNIHSVSYQDAESGVRAGTENISGHLISNENSKDENGSDMEISSNRKRPHIDLMETASQSTSCTNEEMTHNDLNKFLPGEETSTKKLKAESNRVYGRDSGIIDKSVITQDLGYPERHFFPVVSNSLSEYHVGDISLNSGVLKRHHDDDVPNLNLALGAVSKPHGTLPFFVGTLENAKNNDMKKAREQEEDVTASLSLSLSFPLGEKEPPHETTSKLEPVFSGRRHVKNPFHLFKDFPDK